MVIWLNFCLHMINWQVHSHAIRLHSTCCDKHLLFTSGPEFLSVRLERNVRNRKVRSSSADISYLSIRQMHSIQMLFGQIGSVLRKASQLLSSLNFGSIILCYARSRRYKSLVQVIGGWSKRKKSYGPEYGFTITQTSL